MPQHFTILSCGLDLNSRSRRLAQEAQHWLTTAGHTVTFVDLRDFPLPRFDNDTAYHNQQLPVDAVVLIGPREVRRRRPATETPGPET